MRRKLEEDRNRISNEVISQKSVRKGWIYPAKEFKLLSVTYFLDQPHISVNIHRNLLVNYDN